MLTFMQADICIPLFNNVFLVTAHVSTVWQKRIYSPVDECDSSSCRPDFSFLIYPWYIIDGNDAAATAMAEEIKIGADTPPAFVAANQDGMFRFGVLRAFFG